MSKFVIECPKCRNYAEASTGLFAKRKIQCACGNTIDVRTEKLATRKCPKCGNTVISVSYTHLTLPTKRIV